MKDLFENNNNNNYIPKKKTGYKKDNYYNSNSQNYKDENRDYEPKKFYSSKGYHDNDKSLKYDSYKGRRRYDYNYKNYNKDDTGEPSPHFINSSNKAINNDTRITNEEKYNKYNYNKKESDNYRRPKFYGKIKTNNEDYKPGKNYEEKEKEKNEEEAEEENIEKPQFINSQLKENKEENITELKKDGDLFLEKFQKYGDSSEKLEKVHKKRREHRKKEEEYEEEEKEEEEKEEEEKEEEDKKEKNYQYKKRSKNYGKYNKGYSL